MELSNWLHDNRASEYSGMVGIGPNKWTLICKIPERSFEMTSVAVLRWKAITCLTVYGTIHPSIIGRVGQLYPGCPKVLYWSFSRYEVKGIVILVAHLKA